MQDWDKDVRTEERTLEMFARGMKTIYELMGEEKNVLLFVACSIFAITGMNHLFPLLLGGLFDEIPKMVEVSGYTAKAYWMLFAIISVLLISIAFDRFVVETKFLKSWLKLERAWPVSAKEKLLKLSLTFHQRENTGKKISKIEKGCDRLIDIVGDLRWQLITRLCNLAINVSIVLILDWRLGLIFFVPFVPASLLYLHAFKYFGPTYERLEELFELSSGHLCQSIQLIQTVQSFGQEKKELEKFTEVRDKIMEMDIAASIGMQKYIFGAVAIMFITFTLMIWVGIHFLIQKSTSLGTLTYIVYTGGSTFDGLWQIINTYFEIQKRMFAAFRLKDLMDERPDIVSPENAVIPKKFKGKFALRNVHFAYQNSEKKVLDGLNMIIKPGMMVSLAGKSGEGKTTAVKLLNRMIDFTEGTIVLDGNDIRTLDLDWLREKFAIVQQDVQLFDRTVLENVSYAQDVPNEELVEQALRVADLEVILNDPIRFPKGAFEEIGENGRYLSGGEKQRVGIARAYYALMCQARVLILDEATSNLDSETERAIQSMLNELRKHKSISIIAIAHRFSTIMRSDKIYVINGGRVVEEGNHKRLMKQNGLYKQLVDLQELGELEN